VKSAGVFVLLLGAACADSEGPRLVAAMPASTGAGGIVMLTGERLCGSSGDCDKAGGAIRIGLDSPVQANIIAYTDTTAEIRIPSVTPVGRTVLVATVNERSSNALDFEVLAP
jgi:hypothetical protein